MRSIVDVSPTPRGACLGAPGVEHHLDQDTWAVSGPSAGSAGPPGGVLRNLFVAVAVVVELAGDRDERDATVGGPHLRRPAGSLPGRHGAVATAAVTGQT